ncbi:hypothetical protein ACFV4N_18675 [Actinosynnema sp. NPDC059797]
MANLLRSGAPLMEVEDALASAVANSIRRSGGVPRFSAVAEGVRQAAAVGGDGHVVAAIPTCSPDGVVGRLLDEAARTLVTTMQAGMNLVSPKSATELLADRLLDRIAKAGLDHMVPALIAEGHYTMSQLRELLANLSGSKPMADLRDRFIRHPSGEGLRAPDRRTAAKPLDELLNTGLDDL